MFGERWSAQNEQPQNDPCVVSPHGWDWASTVDMLSLFVTCSCSRECAKERVCARVCARVCERLCVCVYVGGRVCVHCSVFVWCCFLCANFLLGVVFLTAEQHLRSYQAWYWLMTVHTHGDFIILCPIRRPGHHATISHTLQSHYPDNVLTSPCPILLMPSAKLHGYRWQFCESLLWLDWDSISGRSTREACALPILPPSVVGMTLHCRLTMMGSLPCCIIASRILKEWHRLQNCSNGGTTTSH